MTIRSLVKLGFAWGPLLFGVGFIAPLLAQSLEFSHFDAPLGLTPIQFGLAVGATSGLIAKRRGRWV